MLDPMREHDIQHESYSPLGNGAVPGPAAELSPIYVLLASQEGSYLNGEVYGATGGGGVA